MATLLSFFENENKSVSRGENHFTFHVESFSASQDVLKGQVYAGMKKKVYNATVSEMR